MAAAKITAFPYDQDAYGYEGDALRKILGPPAPG